MASPKPGIGSTKSSPGLLPDIETISQRENMSERAARMTLSLAFIAPDIIEAVANGTLPRGFGLSRLTDLPISWAKQRQKLGLPARSWSPHPNIPPPNQAIRECQRGQIAKQFLGSHR